MFFLIDKTEIRRSKKKKKKKKGQRNVTEIQLITLK